MNCINGRQSGAECSPSLFSYPSSISLIHPSHMYIQVYCLLSIFFPSLFLLLPTPGLPCYAQPRSPPDLQIRKPLSYTNICSESCLILKVVNVVCFQAASPQLVYIYAYTYTLCQMRVFSRYSTSLAAAAPQTLRRCSEGALVSRTTTCTRVLMHIIGGRRWSRYRIRVHRGSSVWGELFFSLGE